MLPSARGFNFTYKASSSLDFVLFKKSHELLHGRLGAAERSISVLEILVAMVFVIKLFYPVIP